MEPKLVIEKFVDIYRKLKKSDGSKYLVEFNKRLQVTAETLSKNDLQTLDIKDSVVVEFLISLREILHYFSPVIKLEDVFTIFEMLTKRKDLLKIIQTQYNLHSSIAEFMQFRNLQEDELCRQCLQVLDCITEGIILQYVYSSMVYVITKLLKYILNWQLTFGNLALFILSNLTLHNVAVQDFLCKLPNIKNIVTALVATLSDTPPCETMMTISILFHLSQIDPDIEKKLINEKLLITTLKMTVSVLKENYGKYRKADVVLVHFNAICDNPKTFRYFLESPDELNRAIYKVTKLSRESDCKVDNLARCFQFLFAFTDHPVTCKFVSTNVLDLHIETLPNEPSKIELPHFWKYVIDVKTASESTLYASKILKNMLKYSHVSRKYEMFLFILCGNLASMKKFFEFGSSNLILQLSTQQVMLDLLQSLMIKETFRKEVERNLDSKSFHAIASDLLLHIPISNEHMEISKSCAEIVFNIFKVLQYFKEFSKDMKCTLDKVLKEKKLHELLSFCLSSCISELIIPALNISELIGTDIRHKIIEECFITMNDKIEEYRVSELKKTPMKPYQFHKFHPNKALEKDVNDVIGKFNEKGDIKTSEVFCLYEYKFLSFKTRGEELEHLLETKTVALQQSDGLLNDCLRKEAEFNEKFSRLTLLYSKLVEDKENAEQEAMQMQKELDNLNSSLDACRKLQMKDAEEHSNNLQQCKNQYEAEIATIKEQFTTQNNLLKTRVKDAEMTITEINEDLKKCRDDLSNKATALESERKKNCELKNMIEKLNGQNKDLSQGLKMSDLLCKKHVATIEENQKENKDLSEELWKQKQITEQIQKLIGSSMK